MLSNLIKFKIISVILMMLCVCSCGLGSERTPQPVNNRKKYTPNSYYYIPLPPKKDYAPTPYQYQNPASRNYNNPYAVKRQNTYPYYDGDQYYVPPTSYGNYNEDNLIPDVGAQRF